MMLCEEIMKGDVQCVSSRDTVEDAARAMRDEDLGFLPVCDQSGKVLGTITDRDIAIRLVAAKRPGITAIGDVMTRGVVSCSPKDNILRAQELMAEHHKSRIICLDNAGGLVGVISLSDIAQHERGARAAETLRQVSVREVCV
jgi:CBS-domain-containing membrane protein